MTTEVATILALIAIMAIAVAGIGVWWINRPPSILRGESESLPLFTGMGPSALAMVSAPAVPPLVEARRASPPLLARVATVAWPIAAQLDRRPTIREFTTHPARSNTESPVAPLPVAGTDAPVISDTGVPGTMVEGHAIRFSVPADGTLQFLPGRLEIGSGFDAGREIRFVHVPGPDGTEVTFGRNEGALYRHIQLRDKTVSRQHAVLQWRAGHWHLRNLSTTNPVARNGVVLDTIDAPCVQDGDRIEMGEVIFTFRSR